MDPFNASFGCELDQLAALRRQLGAWLEKAGIPDEVQSWIVLATHEAAANAIQHARPCGVVTIEAVIDERTLTIEIADGGAWDGEANNDGDDEHNRGLGVIHQLIDLVDIRTGPQGTTIRLLQSISA